MNLSNPSTFDLLSDLPTYTPMAPRSSTFHRVAAPESLVEQQQSLVPDGKMIGQERHSVVVIGQCHPLGLRPIPMYLRRISPSSMSRIQDVDEDSQGKVRLQSRVGCVKPGTAHQIRDGIDGHA